MTIHKQILLITLAASSMSMHGCSGLMKITALHAETEGSGWVAQPPIQSRRHSAFMFYEYQQDRFTVIMCSLPQRYDMIAIGPPLIPIIPGKLLPVPPMGPEAEIKNFFIYIQIDSPDETVQIDFSQIQLRLNNDGKILGPSIVNRYRNDEQRKNVCMRNIEHFQEVPPQQVIIDERAQYLLFFDVQASDVESFVVDLGYVTDRSNKIEIPPLEYRKEGFYFYEAFAVPPGGH